MKKGTFIRMDFVFQELIFCCLVLAGASALNSGLEKQESSTHPLMATRTKREVSELLNNSANGTDEDIKECTRKVDLGFLIDSSGSVKEEDFERMKTFVKRLTDHFKISPNFTRVAVITYNSRINVRFLFSQLFESQNELDTAIDEIGYTGGGTNTGAALTIAYTVMFNPVNGCRLSDAEKILILLTDGESFSSVEEPSQQLKNIGVTIITVGVITDRFSVLQLERMASCPLTDHYHLLHNFTEFFSLGLAEKISSSTCNASSYRVLCEKHNITVVIGRNDVSHLDLDNLHLADSTCKAKYNETHVYITTGLNECGTTYFERGQKMHYNNTLRTSDSEIGKEGSFAYQFSCTYGRSRNISGLQFQRSKQVVEVTQQNTLNTDFSVRLESYADPTCPSTSYEDFPAFKSLNERINILYDVVFKTRKFHIFVRAETCRATPSNNSDDRPQYEFISDG
ncbi:uncharacterized protein LOC114538138 [Dendronephthya gigantea]|uniref:uncharacterized protein LOC114538138 n=1 Tax=Dendronephthya gigantea TaxID=151771 RepID=UPI00106AFBF4|nr:uncharacterized protein LOC114538138 [Dendronephthya gigantea]